VITAVRLRRSRVFRPSAARGAERRIARRPRPHLRFASSGCPGAGGIRSAYRANAPPHT